MRVHYDPLDVLQIRVMLQSAHVQPTLLAQLRDARPVIVRESAVGENGVGHLGVCH